MQRFYLIIASLLAAAGQMSFARLSAGHERMREALIWVLAGCCAWSLWESRQLIGAARDRTSSAEVSAQSGRPENIFLTNDSYGLFANLPRYFSNGVIDPRAQARLLSADKGKPLPLPEMLLVQSGPLVGSVDANPGILKLAPTFPVVYGRR